MDVLYNATVYRNEAGQVQGVFAAARDITERKRAEQELARYRDQLEDLVRQRTEALRQTAEELARSNKDLEQFAYVASHDLQEPLRMVTGFMGLLQEKYRDRLDDDGRPVHRLRHGRRAADAGAHQRPPGLLAGRQPGRSGAGPDRRPGTLSDGPWRTCGTGLAEIGRPGDARRPADRPGRRPATGATLPEPRGQRPEVPRGRRRRESTSTPAATARTGSSRSATTASASTRSSRTASS